MIKKQLIFFLAILILFSSAFTFVSAQTTTPTTGLDYSGWVKCDGVVTSGEKDRQVPCTFINLMAMVKALVNWLFGISIPIIVGLLAYSGFLHMTGTEANIKKSYSIMQQAIIGFIVMLMAWFIVTTILKWVLKPWATNVSGTLIETQK